MLSGETLYPFKTEQQERIWKAIYGPNNEYFEKVGRAFQEDLKAILGGDNVKIRELPF